MNILLADDSDIVRNRLRDLLSEIPGAHVVGEATTKEEAIAFVSQLQPDLLFMNFQLPGGSGLETLRTIKDFPSLPLVVVLTDNASQSYQTSCRSSGADYVLDKAFDIDKIQTLIQDLPG